jgi:hypothetical protein
MASQTNGRNTGAQGNARVRFAHEDLLEVISPDLRAPVNRSERPSTPFRIHPTDIPTLIHDRAWLQGMSRQLAASHSSMRDGENFLCGALESCLNYYSAQEQKYENLFQLYKNMEAKYGSSINEMHATVMKNLNLLQEIGKADSIIDAANRRVENLDTLNANLTEANMSLRQDLNQAREVICGLEKRIMELEPPRGVATESKNTDIHELDTVVPVLPDARIMGLTQPEDGDNRLDAQETDSTIALVGMTASPSPDNGGRQNAEENQNAEDGRRKPGGRKGKLKKLARANPGLGISCS